MPIGDVDAGAPRCRARVVTLRLRSFEPALGVAVLRGIGWRAECDCGWRGGRRSTYSAARAELREHVRPVS